MESVRYVCTYETKYTYIKKKLKFEHDGSDGDDDDERMSKQWKCEQEKFAIRNYGP